MTRFLDGPAAGTVLMLRRAPVFLRAVQAPGGTWDALDQLDDIPEADEAIAVYVLEGEPSFFHIRRDRRAGGSFCGRGGTYRLVQPAPDDAAVRSTTAWRAWTQAEGMRRFPHETLVVPGAQAGQP